MLLFSRRDVSNESRIVKALSGRSLMNVSISLRVLWASLILPQEIAVKVRIRIVISFLI